jgi:MoaA/NifB/PqqE/SkfB family radical SAM enzyme
MHPLIADFAARARKLGYKTVQIQTNGRAFTYKRLLEKLKTAGVNEISPSLHGAKPETHDALTRSPGSFLQTVAGIKNAAQMGFNVLTNSVITSLNYRELPELAGILIKLGVRQYQFAFTHMVGTALENKNWIVPRKTDIMPWVKKGLDIGRNAGIPCFTEAIPFCLMKGYEGCVAERVIPEGPVADADKFIESYGDYRRTEGKAKGPRCPACKYFNVCEGPWREYPEIYGWKEFPPVRNFSKKNLRPARRPSPPPKRPHS